MDRSSGIPRPSSGIPRLSRLPVPASRAPAKTSSNAQVRPTPSTEGLRGRTSTVSTFGARQTVGRGSSALSKKPVARPATAQSNASGNEDDTLGDLEGFRSLSRASSRPEVDSVVDDEEDDDFGFENSGTRKFSQSSTLTDRTRESLSMISSPPGGRKSRSSFFGDADDSMGPPARPASATSTNSRPGTSNSMYRSNFQARPSTPSSRASTTARPSTLRPPSAAATPSRRSASAAAPRTPATLGSRLQRPGTSQETTDSLKSPSTSRLVRTPFSGSKTVGRLPKTRPTVGDMFGDPSASPASKVTSGQAIRKPKATPVTAKKISSTNTEASGDPERKVGNSSAALREQIRSAKAAKIAAAKQEQRKASPEEDQPAARPSNNDFDYGVDDEDPFNQLPKGGEAVIKRRVANARSDGNLNIANMGLDEIPEAVMSMYEFDPNSDFAWGETVDLTKFNAADNKIVGLPDDLFPDIDPPTDFDDDDVKGPQFGGLEKLDLHGNLLKQIPLGLRKLGVLTSLNLSRNQLSNDCFEIVSQIAGLKELKLSETSLEGELPDAISRLENLEVLDLRGNRISSLPVSIQALASLRICNIAGNQLGSAQLGAFEKTPLVELYLANNRLSGTFFADEDGFTRLQVLDLSGNSLTAFSNDEVALPALSVLNISQNRISNFPDISTWTNLLSLQAGENKLSELPQGFSTLNSLKHANFTGNDIKTVDPTIGSMENLETLSIAQNPLRERKFLTMSTDDLKRSLVARIQPTEDDEDGTGAETLNGAEDGTAGIVPANGNSMWTIKPGGILDLSSRDLSTLDPDEFTQIADSIRQLVLHQNTLTAIPSPISLATSLTKLDLSSNSLTTTTFTTPTTLPHLRTLLLNANKITSLAPLTTTLTAPNLALLDLTHNRLTGALPTLRPSFPALTTLLAADNRIETVTADALRGLTAVNLRNNAIAKLEPQIGLLAPDLKGLEVGGNTFRVPGHAVLSKGTEAVLRWLRDKVPRDESAEAGDQDDEF